MDIFYKIPLRNSSPFKTNAVGITLHITNGRGHVVADGLIWRGYFVVFTMLGAESPKTRYNKVQGGRVRARRDV